MWWTQKRQHAADAHPYRDPATLGYPDSLDGIHVGGSPQTYFRHDHHVPRRSTDDEDEADDEAAPSLSTWDAEM